MQLGVSVLFSPKAERNGGQFVDHGLGETVPGEVNGFHIGLTTVAAFHPNVGKGIGGVNGKLGVIFLAAAGADDAAEFPFRKAETTQKATPATVALLPQNPERRFAITERTHRMRVAFKAQAGAGPDELCVRLQKSESQEVARLGWGFYTAPALIEQVRLRTGSRCAQVLGDLCQAIRTTFFNGGKKIGEAAVQFRQIQPVRQRSWRIGSRCTLDALIKTLLKARGVDVESENLCGKSVLRGEMLGSPDALLPWTFGHGRLSGFESEHATSGSGVSSFRVRRSFVDYAQ